MPDSTKGVDVPTITQEWSEPDRSVLSQLHSSLSSTPGSLPRGTRFAFRPDGTCYPVVPPPVLVFSPGRPESPEDLKEATFSHFSTTGLDPVYNFKTLRPTLAAEVLGPDERGLLLMPPMRRDGETLKVKRQLDRMEIRLALLFWDRVDCPQSNTITTHLGDDGDYLLREGFLQRSLVEFSPGHDILDATLAAPVLIYKALNKRDPGRWSVSRGERDLSLLDAEIKAERGVIFELHQAIPVPDRDVPLEAVLEFRQKRRPEMLRLRHHLEHVYQAIISAPDRELAKASALSELDAALADHARVSKESGMRFRLADVKAKLDQSVLIAGAATYAAATKSGLSACEAALSGAAGAVFASITLEKGLGANPTVPTPFEYVSRFNSELTWIG